MSTRSIVFAFIVMLVSGNYVWSRVGGGEIAQLMGDQPGNWSKSNLFEQNQSFSNELSRLLGRSPVDRREPRLADTIRFANNLPSRFEDVARELAAASGRKRPRDGTADDNRLPSDRSVTWHEPSLAEILKMTNNAQSQFADVNRILGVRSSDKNPQNQSAGVNRLMEILSVDWSTLNPVERDQTIRDANFQTAFVFRKWLPMPTAFSDVSLFAIDPAGTTLRYSYRITPSQKDSNISQIGEKLRDQVCQQSITRLVIRHGGQYEIVLFDSDEQIIDQFIISESSCA